MMKDDHMHLEMGEYTEEYVRQFVENANDLGIEEICFTEHSHAFKEFQSLYEHDLIVHAPNEEIRQFQQEWLQGKKKFEHTLDEYISFMQNLQTKGYPVKIGIEVCNFQDQQAVMRILEPYRESFDQIMVSIHYIRGWGFDFSKLKHYFQRYPLVQIWEDYVAEIEHVLLNGKYDSIGHPFNLRLFKDLPNDDDVEYLVERAIKVIAQSGVRVDINTGTKHRYPIAEITPFPLAMAYLKRYHVPIQFGSDAHHPEDVGKYFEEAFSYAKHYKLL